jgi:hypothetical protein
MTTSSAFVAPHFFNQAYGYPGFYPANHVQALGAADGKVGTHHIGGRP